MRHWLRTPIGDEPALFPGYSLRQATTSDAVALGVVLTEAFGVEWSEAKVLQELLEHPNVPKTFLVEHDGQAVATASYQLHPGDFPQSGWVHWVGARPREQGNGLGRVVVHAVLRESLANGKVNVGLNTEDFRVPAIRTYLKLGFEPEMCDDSHPARWEKILQGQVP